MEAIFLATPVEPTLICPKCRGEMERVLSIPGSYKIKGNNSASVTPKKFRGGSGNNNDGE